MKILVVEDDHKIADAIKQGLMQEGFAVDVEYTGTGGYDMASEGSYDLIILDLMLPQMDGMEICSNLRNKGVRTPILILTSKSELEDKVLGLNQGADDYLTKPFAFTELLARVRALLRRPQEVIPDKLNCGDLELDTQAFTVKRAGKPIDLSKKEFSLLEYLLRNKNKIVSKEKILEHVWDFNSDVLPNTVEVYIGYLRTKIDKNFPSKPNFIKTIRGFGYKLEETSTKHV